MVVSSLEPFSRTLADEGPIGADGRGFVVTVYVDPSSSVGQLRAFENGGYGGPIFA